MISQEIRSWQFGYDDAREPRDDLPRAAIDRNFAALG